MQSISELESRIQTLEHDLGDLEDEAYGIRTELNMLYKELDNLREFDDE